MQVKTLKIHLYTTAGSSMEEVPPGSNWIA